jgi:hypothetical protein
VGGALGFSGFVHFQGFAARKIFASSQETEDCSQISNHSYNAVKLKLTEYPSPLSREQGQRCVFGATPERDIAARL